MQFGDEIVVLEVNGKAREEKSALCVVKIDLHEVSLPPQPPVTQVDLEPELENSSSANASSERPTANHLFSFKDRVKQINLFNDK